MPPAADAGVLRRGSAAGVPVPEPADRQSLGRGRGNLLAFVSHPVLFYRDMVATEGIIDLFGTMLVFHGIAVFSASPVGGDP